MTQHWPWGRHNEPFYRFRFGVPTFDQLPKWLHAIVHSGITLAAISAVVLDVLFNGGRSSADIERELVMVASAGGEH
ncbi:MAG: hypothetical protein ABI537_16840 [Casimicrobiaceae bacterium]